MPPALAPILSADEIALTDLLQDCSLNPAEPLASQVYRILRDEIVTLRLRPGQLVSEKDIADVLDASKTPVREALIRLEIDGLVDIVPKSGTYVTPIRINKYIEACFTRLQLEIGAVRRAASHATDISLAEELDEIIEQQAEALALEDYVQFFTLDQALHRNFFEMAGLPGVWEQMLKTQADVNRMRHLKRVQNIRRGPAVLEEHRAIVDAIRRRDAAGAEEALVAHIGSLDKEFQQFSANPALLEFIENQASHSRRSRK
ncbi:MAG: GntR family transcriptional regulator [Granulosicoccus sp.]|nr:GntR family transcriptional regulator [Granulosicoccus sp.]